jgi:hypothetical protein
MGKAKPFDIPKREVWEAFNRHSPDPGSSGARMALSTGLDNGILLRREQEALEAGD